MMYVKKGRGEVRRGGKIRKKGGERAGPLPPLTTEKEKAARLPFPSLPPLAFTLSSEKRGVSRSPDGFGRIARVSRT